MKVCSKGRSAFTVRWCRAMNITKIRSFCARLVGMRYREMPGAGGDAKSAIMDMLAGMGAEFCGESGSPASRQPVPYIKRWTGWG
jgi:hypothetical protein